MDRSKSISKKRNYKNRNIRGGAQADEANNELIKELSNELYKILIHKETKDRDVVIKDNQTITENIELNELNKIIKEGDYEYLKYLHDELSKHLDPKTEPQAVQNTTPVQTVNIPLKKKFKSLLNIEKIPEPETDIKIYKFLYGIYQIYKTSNSYEMDDQTILTKIKCEDAVNQLNLKFTLTQDERINKIRLEEVSDKIEAKNLLKTLPCNNEKIFTMISDFKIENTRHRETNTEKINDILDKLKVLVMTPKASGGSKEETATTVSAEATADQEAGPGEVQEAVPGVATETVSGDPVVDSGAAPTTVPGEATAATSSCLTPKQLKDPEAVSKFVQENINEWNKKKKQLDDNKSQELLISYIQKFLNIEINKKPEFKKEFNIKEDCKLSLSQITWNMFLINRAQNISNELLYKSGTNITHVDVELKLNDNVLKCIDIKNDSAQDPSNTNLIKFQRQELYSSNDDKSTISIGEGNITTPHIDLGNDNIGTLDDPETNVLKLNTTNIESIAKQVWDAYVDRYFKGLEELFNKNGNELIKKIKAIKDNTEGNSELELDGAISSFNLSGKTSIEINKLINQNTTTPIEQQAEQSLTSIVKASKKQNESKENVLIQKVSVMTPDDITTEVNNIFNAQSGGASGSKLVTEHSGIAYPDKAMTDVDLQGLLNIWGKIPSKEETGIINNFLGDASSDLASPYSQDSKYPGELTDNLIKIRSEKGKLIDEHNFDNFMKDRLLPYRKHPSGKKRYEKFVRPVTNLLLITKKLRDFHKLSIAYKQKHLEVEELVITIRNMYYMLIFIRDQIVGIDKLAEEITKAAEEQTDDINVLIEQIAKSMDKNAEDFVDTTLLENLKNRQRILKKHRNSLTKAYEYAANSLLTRLNKIGATINDVTSIDEMPTNYVKTDISARNKDQGEAELQKFEKDIYNDLLGYDNSLLVEITLPEKFREKISGKLLSEISKTMDKLLEGDSYFKTGDPIMGATAKLSNVFDDYNSPNNTNSTDNSTTISTSQITNLTKLLQKSQNKEVLTNKDVSVIINDLFKSIVPLESIAVGGSYQSGGASPTVANRFEDNTYQAVITSKNTYQTKINNLVSGSDQEDLKEENIKNSNIQVLDLYNDGHTYYKSLNDKNKKIILELNTLLKNDDVELKQKFTEGDEELLKPDTVTNILDGTNTEVLNGVNPGTTINNYKEAAKYALDYESSMEEMISLGKYLNKLYNLSVKNSDQSSTSPEEFNTKFEDSKLQTDISTINSVLTVNDIDKSRDILALSDKSRDILALSTHIADKHKSLAHKIISSAKKTPKPYILTTYNGIQVLSKDPEIQTKLNFILQSLTRNPEFQKAVKYGIYSKISNEQNSGYNNKVTAKKFNVPSDKQIKLTDDNNAINKTIQALNYDSTPDDDKQLIKFEKEINAGVGTLFPDVTSSSNSAPTPTATPATGNTAPAAATPPTAEATATAEEGNPTTSEDDMYDDMGGGGEFIVDIGNYSAIQSGGDVVLTYAKPIKAPLPKPRFEHYDKLKLTPGFIEAHASKDLKRIFKKGEQGIKNSLTSVLSEAIANPNPTVISPK